MDFNDLKIFIKEEVEKLHKKTLLEEKKTEIEKELKLLKEDKWIQKAFKNKKGSLHKDLGIPEDEKIPVGKMKQALNNPRLRRKALAAINANPDVYGSLKK